MNTAIPNRYLLATNFQQSVTELFFPAEVWCVASALSGATEPSSPFELEKMTGLGYDQVREALGRLLAKELVREKVMSWEEFNEAKAKAGTTGRNAEMRIAPAASTPPNKHANTPAETDQHNGHSSAQQGVAMRLGTITPSNSAVAATSAWIRQDLSTPLTSVPKPTTVAVMPSGNQSGGRLLRPILEQIESIKGGGVEGQLLVYQVFLRVPYNLLCEEGIKSLHFVNEETMIHNPQLLAAIFKASKDVIGIDLS